MLIFFVTVLIGAVYGQVPNPCVNDDGSINPDGHYEVSCKTYVICTNGNPNRIECDADEAYNQDLTPRGCDSLFNVPHPCGYIQDCTGVPDGNYPLMEPLEDNVAPCQMFYTCLNEEYLQMQQCPGDLVWDITRDICNHAYDVFPPCGTKGN
uniref:Chitin-binding type-2 domain-containing protein n=1 Tax=Phragmatopoma lapidosa TaxID=341668 RepID=A0A0K1R028_9ANNE|nr:hypothetical protein [Phragmatopoma lapidosa]